MEKAYNAERAGAKAILVMDDREEQLLTMAAPEDHPEIAKLREDITIPTALVRRVRLPDEALPAQAPCGLTSDKHAQSFMTGFKCGDNHRKGHSPARIGIVYLILALRGILQSC